MTFSAHALRCTFLPALLVCNLSACNTPTAIDRDFGLAVQKAQRAQTLAPSMHPPVAMTPGTDAGIVRSSIVRYEKTYVTPPSPISSLDQGLGTANTGSPR